MFAKQDRFAAIGYFLEDRAGAVELHPGLVDVIEEHALADFNRAFIEGTFPQADAQERGFADAIAANDTGALGGFERESQPAEQPPWPVAFPDLRSRVAQLDGVVPQAGRGWNEQVHFPFFGRRFEALDLVKGFEAMPRLGPLRPDACAHPVQLLA